MAVIGAGFGYSANAVQKVPQGGAEEMLLQLHQENESKLAEVLASNKTLIQQNVELLQALGHQHNSNPHPVPAAVDATVKLLVFPVPFVWIYMYTRVFLLGHYPIFYLENCGTRKGYVKT